MVSLPIPFAPPAGHVASTLYRSGRATAGVIHGVLGGPEPMPFLPGLLPGTSPRITSCTGGPILFSNESCIPVGDVSSPSLPPPYAELSMHRRHYVH